MQLISYTCEGSRELTQLVTLLLQESNRHFVSFFGLLLQDVHPYA